MVGRAFFSLSALVHLSASAGSGALGKPLEIEAQMEELGEIETRDVDWNLLGAAQ